MELENMRAYAILCVHMCFRGQDLPDLNRAATSKILDPLMPSNGPD
jgi:hypothetical protein